MYLKIGIITCIFFQTHFISAQTSTPVEIKSQLEYHGLSKKLIDAKENTFSLKSYFIKLKQHEDDEKEMNAIHAADNIKKFDKDGALQKTGEVTTEAIILHNLPGIKSNYLRSDNNIAVGPNHVVQIINSNSNSSYIRVWDKSGEVIINRSNLFDLFGFHDYGDPNIIYDEQADRYVITFLYSGAANKLIIVASETADPTGAWYFYTFDTPSGFPDYEKLGVWGDSYIVTISAGKPAAYALNRNDILNGIGTSPVLMFKPKRIPIFSWQGLSPISQTGSTPIPADEPAIIARVIDDAWYLPETSEDKLEIFSLHINWDDPESSYMTGPLSLPIESYNSDLCGFSSNNCLEQKESDKLLWPISTFLMDKPQYRNFGDHQSFVCSHVCNADGEGTAGVRWYEIRKELTGDWYIYQQSTYLPNEFHHWASSISINEEGSIGLGYNITSASIYPSIRIAGRAACDPINTITTGEIEVINSTSPNLTLNWGDYNSLVTDPIDGSFWFTSQWNPSPKWATNVVHFSIEGCEEEKQTIESNYNQSKLQFQPSPANSICTISFTSIINSTGKLFVYDPQGNEMMQQDIIISEEKNSLTINTGKLNVGIYLVQIFSQNETWIGSIAIQR